MRRSEEEEEIFKSYLAVYCMLLRYYVLCISFCGS